MTTDLLIGILSSSAVAGVAGWIGNTFVGERASRMAQRANERKAEVDVEIHRDGLTFELLTAAREQITSVQREVEELRSEASKMRSLEQHFYHLQQALEHIDALISPSSDRASAERNARAFLNRMRRLNDAKGTIANEAQVAASTISIVERNVDEAAPKAARQSRTRSKNP